MNSTLSANQTGTFPFVSNTTQTNSIVTVNKTLTNQTVPESSAINKTDNISKTNSTDIKKHRHHQFLHQ